MGVMARYEIEVKSLLGEPANAEALKERMLALDADCTLTGSNRQLNHYFEGGDINDLVAAVAPHLSAEQLDTLQDMAGRGRGFSVRTRQKDDEVLLVVKASVDEGTSANSVSRLEFEEPVGVSLDELDALVQGAGFRYQAKWSRSREEYAYKGMNVCMDRNAGYGYLAEFEKVIEDEAAVASARAEIDAVMAELGVAELPQDRLERMFAHYNQHWPEYYGTDKVFIIE